jgi:hypothetical protein
MFLNCLQCFAHTVASIVVVRYQVGYCNLRPISVRSDYWLGHQLTKTENTKVILLLNWLLNWLAHPQFFIICTSSKDFVFDLLFKVTEVPLDPLSGHVLQRLLIWNFELTYVGLGQLTSQTKFRSDLILALASRGGQTRNRNNCYFSWTMAGSSPNFHHIVWPISVSGPWSWSHNADL